VTKLLRACQRFLLWNEAVYLHSNYEEYDNAVKIMIEHSPTAFKHDIFVTNIQKVSNHDLLYKAVTFYLEEEPARLNELLKCITLKVDLSKVVQEVFPILFPQTKMFPRSEIVDTLESSPSGYNPSNPKTTKP
jgi:clathrin heavy chain